MRYVYTEAHAVGVGWVVVDDGHHQVVTSVEADEDGNIILGIGDEVRTMPSNETVTVVKQ